MALGSALVDRAARLTEEGTGQSVQGTKQHTPDLGPDFRCRLELQEGNERNRQERTTGEVRPRLMTGKKALDGTALIFRQDDKVRVISPELGTATWKVVGEPKPMRKRRTLLGWELNLVRVVEAEPKPGAEPANPPRI